MPFKSDRQRKKCYALKAKHKNGSWNCDEWAHAQKGGQFTFLSPKELALLNQSVADNTTIPGTTIQPKIATRLDAQSAAVTNKAKKEAVAKELLRRKADIAKSNKTNKPEDSALGDKLRFFPNDPNSFVDEYLNPLKMVGDMADNIGHTLPDPNSTVAQKAMALGVPILSGLVDGALKGNKKAATTRLTDEELLHKHIMAADNTINDYQPYLDELELLQNKAPLSGRIKMSQKQLDDLKDSYRAQFEKEVGKQYTEKDLGLYAKLQEANKLELEDMHSKKMQKNEDFINKHNLRTKYTPEEEVIVDAYTKGYDSYINNRNTLGKPAEAVQQKFYNSLIRPKLEDLITSQKLKDAEHLYRTNGDYHIQDVWRGDTKLPENSLKFSELQPGDVWQPNSFLSTSIDDGLSFGSISSQIKAPKGQSVLFPNATGVKNYEDELEVILPSKLKFKVDEIKPPLDGTSNRFVHSIVNPYTPLPLAVGAGAYINSKQQNGGKPNNMKKKRYQFAGQNNPCGEGTQWDAKTMQCIPIPTNPNLDPVFQMNNVGTPTNFNEGAFTKANGKVVNSDVVPITSNGVFDPTVGAIDARGTFVPQQQVIGDAIDKGFNLDSDNVYRKQQITVNPNILGYSDPFKALNLGLNLTQAIAGEFNDIKTKKQEKYNLLKARYNKAYFNPYEKGLNNVNVYQKGGANSYDCPPGVDCSKSVNPLAVFDFLKADPAKQNLRSLKRAEREYIQSGQYLIDRAGFMKNNLDFGKYPAHSFDPQPSENGVYYGVGENILFNKVQPLGNQGVVTAQKGGSVNNTGYTPGTNTFKNSFNVIPSSNITMKNTPFPVMAYPDNGEPTLMHPGMDYNFKGAKYVTEVPMQTGGTPEVEGVGPSQGDAELEQGEVFQSQQGTIQKVAESEDRHEQGGSVQPNVHRVLEDTADKRKDKDSKLLRITPTEAKAIVGFKPKETVSHSKLYEKATEFYDKKLRKSEKRIETNLKYIKNNGGQYAQNSLELNLKLLSSLPTKEQLFDTIYQHQETVKAMHNISNNTDSKAKTGGKFIPKFQNAGEVPKPYAGGLTKAGRITPTGLDNAFTFDGGLAAYINAWKPAGLDLTGYTDNAQAQGAVYDFLLQNDPDVIREMWLNSGNTAKGINENLPKVFNRDYLSDMDNLKKLRDAYTDGMFGRRTLVPPPPPPQPQAPPVNNTPDVNTPYDTPEGITPSKFNMPLKWYDIAGNVANYLSSAERIPVSFEQLDRDPLRVHELNPQPALDANTGDFRAVASQLPNDGVGFANQANLLSNKYKVNNEIVGQYANQNATRADQIDMVNSNNKFQLDQFNLSLRDRAVNQQLQGMEVQRQSKLNAFDDYLTKLAQNAAFNRNGNLILQLTPFFDQNGKFNGNKYIFQDQGNGIATVSDKKTGKVIKTITQDGVGTTQQVKTYIRG
jgi:hypothetical protein